MQSIDQEAAEKTLKDKLFAEQSWELYKKDPRVIQRWDFDELHDILKATNLSQWKRKGQNNFAEMQDFGKILKKRLLFENESRIKQNSVPIIDFENKKPLSFGQKLIGLFINIDWERDVFDEKKISVIEKKNMMNETITYIFNPKPQFGCYEGTNVPIRSSILPSDDFYTKKTKVVLDPQEQPSVSSNASSTNQVDCKKIH